MRTPEGNVRCIGLAAAFALSVLVACSREAPPPPRSAAGMGVPGGYGPVGFDAVLRAELVSAEDGSPLPGVEVRTEVRRPPESVPDIEEWTSLPAGVLEVAARVEDSLVLTLHVRAPGFVQDSFEIAIGRSTPISAVSLSLTPETKARPLPSPTRATPPPPPQGSGMGEPVRVGRVAFGTSPAGAVVRLMGDGGRFELVSPGSIEVPAGIYDWEVELAGHAPEVSTTPLAVGPDETVEIRRTLTAATFDELKRQGDLEFRRGNCAAAARSYRALGTTPPQAGGRLATEFAEAQLHLGRCLLQEREYAEAERRFELVLVADPNQYVAAYYLGVVACEVGEFRRGEEQLGRLAGEFAGRIGPGSKAAVQALANYQAGVCAYREWRRGNPGARMAAISAFLGFRDRAEDIISRSLGPPALLAELQSARTDAQSKLDELGVR